MSSSGVIIQTSIRNIQEVLELAGKISTASNCPVVFLGHAASVLPDLFLQSVSGPSAVIGPSAVSLKGDISPALLEALRYAIDSHYPCDRRVFPASAYAIHPLRAKGLRFAALCASYGCPYRCSFCLVPHGRHCELVVRNAREVVDEIQMLRRDFGIRGIWFEDEQPLGDRAWFEELLREIRNRLPDCVFEFPNGLRPELLDQALLSEMAKSGVTRIALGIETGDDLLRESLGRCSDMGVIAHAVEVSRRLGLITTGYFMIGLPNETVVQLSSTIRWARRLPLHHAHISVFWPVNPPILKATNEMRALGVIRSLVYGGIYAKVDRQRALWQSSELSFSRLGTATSRMCHWIGSLSRGGGGW
jgi:radical SAM superfamily enzyme YgiQ (UPF0313 family)